MFFSQVTRIDYTGDKVIVKTPQDEYLTDKVSYIKSREFSSINHL